MLRQRKNWKAATRDQRLQILILRSNGMTYKAIALKLNVTERTVQYALTQGHPSPSKNRGRKPKMTPEQKGELIQYVTSSAEAWQETYLELVESLQFPGVGQYAIRNTLRNAGFTRCVAREKPTISEANKEKRYRFAEEHLWWTKADWMRVLWTDETWVMGGVHTKLHVTHRHGESYDPTCIVPRQKRKKGWMFWGSFAGLDKGPSLTWDPSWGKITSASYCQHTVPLISDFMVANPGYFFMQDNAPAHSAANTEIVMQQNGLEPIEWPPYSPDLNPIENVWNVLKNYLQDNYPRQLNPSQLRAALQAAWDSIEPDFLEKLIDLMYNRCWDVILADGGATGY